MTPTYPYTILYSSAIDSRLHNKYMNRLKQIITDLAQFGMQPDGSVSRVAFSKETREAAKAVQKCLDEAGLTTRIDKVGSVHGLLQGSRPELGIIAIGSHIDSVKNGGIFDGALGVAAAIECVLRMREQGYIPQHSIEVLGFEAEEGSELGGTLGSHAMLGNVDTSIKGFAELAAKCNLTIQDIQQTRVNSSKYRAYLELHIEQGDTLYLNGSLIGVVSGIVGITRYRIISNGESNHSGTTSMIGRKDALTGMAKLLVKADEMARGFAKNFVCTAGTISVTPGSVNVIPGRAECILELRHMERSVIEAFINKLKREADQLEKVTFSFGKIIDKSSVLCDPVIIELIERICIDRGIKHELLPSGAGHDANAMAAAMPVGMIFVPSKDGYSHCAKEWSKWEDCELGADVLYHTLLALDSLQ